MFSDMYRNYKKLKEAQERYEWLKSRRLSFQRIQESHSALFEFAFLNNLNLQEALLEATIEIEKLDKELGGF